MTPQRQPQEAYEGVKWQWQHPPLYLWAVVRAISQWRWYSSLSLCLCASDFLPGFQGLILYNRKWLHPMMVSLACGCALKCSLATLCSEQLLGKGASARIAFS